MDQDNDESKNSESDEEDNILVWSPVPQTIQWATHQNAHCQGGQEDKTYKQVWKQFKKIVNQEVCLQVPPFLTRDAIDLCFTTVIANKAFTPPYA